MIKLYQNASPRTPSIGAPLAAGAVGRPAAGTTDISAQPAPAASLSPQSDPSVISTTGGEGPTTGISGGPPAPDVAGWLRNKLVLGGIAAIALVALGWWALGGFGVATSTGRGDETGEEVVGLEPIADTRPSVAVLYFDNLSGDDSLDWLRSGLTDLLVTDLSQSPDLRVLALLTVSAFGSGSAPYPQAAAQQRPESIREFQTGDVFAAIGDGRVEHYDSELQLLKTLNTGHSGQNTGMAFDSDGNLYVTNFDDGSITRFSKSGAILEPNPFVRTERGNESIVFDADGNFYVGVALGSDDVFRFDAEGNPLGRFNVVAEEKGADWVDLDGDQRTLFYTSEGRRIFRFDVIANAQSSDFATLPGEGTAFALRLLPRGGLLVADSGNIKRLDASGNVVRSYGNGERDWFALNLDPDERWFWSGDIATNSLAKFDFETGELLIQTQTNGPLRGVAVFGEITFARPLVPELLTLTLEEATRRLVDVGLQPGEVVERTSGEDDLPGTIVGQSPPSGTRLDPGAEVQLVVSVWVPVPSLVDLSEEAARQRLLELELEPGAIETRLSEQAVGTVLDQAPSPGEELPAGSEVALVVATGVEAPALIGRRVEEVGQLLSEASLRPGEVTEQDASDENPAGTVLTQTPLPGQLVPVSGSVDYTVAVAPPPNAFYWVTRVAAVMAAVAILAIVVLPSTVYLFPTFSDGLGLTKLVVRLGLAAPFASLGVKLLQSTSASSPATPVVVTKPHSDLGEQALRSNASFGVDAEIRLRGVGDKGRQSLHSKHPLILTGDETEER